MFIKNKYGIELKFLLMVYNKNCIVLLLFCCFICCNLFLFLIKGLGRDISILELCIVGVLCLLSDIVVCFNYN